MLTELMSSAAMAIQDQSGGSRGSNTVLRAENQVPLTAGLHSVADIQLNEQFASMDDHAPKARKPYTITKQRERWSEEEHKKFLEALKLYGRAWRRIEEHVGTKTAVQIRSHAQKFFSKVVRESSGSNVSSVEPIEIPPPRPKRKPMHPYPRKQVHPFRGGISVPELPFRSASPNLSISEQENRSPSSVLSAVGSDTLGSADSNSPNGSVSPVSSATGINTSSLLLSDPNFSLEENRSPSPAPEEQVPVKFNSFRGDGVFAKELVEEESTRSLKLFGRTVLVTDSHRPSSPTTGSCKPLPADVNEGKPEEMPSKNIPAEVPLANTECMWSHLPHGASAAVYYMQLQNDNSSSTDVASARALPLWAIYGGVPVSFLAFHNAETMKGIPDSNLEAAQEKEMQKEESWTGSNTGSISEGECGDKRWDLEHQSRWLSLDKEEKEPPSVLQFKSSEKAASEHGTCIPKKSMKGFVPYKRCFTEQDTRSSTKSVQEREEQRIRLCL